MSQLYERAELVGSELCHSLAESQRRLVGVEAGDNCVIGASMERLPVLPQECTCDMTAQVAGPPFAINIMALSIEACGFGTNDLGYLDCDTPVRCVKADAVGWVGRVSRRRVQPEHVRAIESNHQFFDNVDLRLPLAVRCEE